MTGTAFDWKVILVLLVAAVLVATAIVLAIMMRKIKRSLDHERWRAETWKGRCMNSRDEVRRHVSLAANRKLSDADAVRKLRERVDRWDPAEITGEHDI